MRGQISPCVASGAGWPYCSCWVMSSQTILHSATPAEPQPSSHTQPVPVSGDHHIADKNKMLHLLPNALFRNTLLPERTLVTI